MLWSCGLMFFVSASMLVLPGSGYALATPLSLAVGDQAAAVAVPTCSSVGSMVADVRLAA